MEFQVGRSLLALAVSCVWGFAPAAMADDYRLVIGDRVSVDFLGQGSPVLTQIDIDGRIRLPDVGGTVLSGLTLEEAEDAVEASAREAGIFVDPLATVSISEYAPIVVMGDVSQPGRFEYLPGMLVSTAVGLSGGSRAGGVNQFDVDRASVEAKGLLTTLNLGIASEAVKIARLEALLAEEPTVVLSDQLRGLIPNPQALPVDDMLEREQARLSNEQARRTETLALMKEEITSLEEQQALFVSRIEVQEGIVGNALKELETAQELRDRGLQTAARLSTAEQREADARSRVLELQSSQIAVTRLLADAKRARVRLLRVGADEALAALQVSQALLNDLQLRYAKNAELLAILQGGNASMLMASDAVELTFSLQSPRDGRPGDMEITQNTRVLPGDTLIVRVAPIGLGGSR